MTIWLELESFMFNKISQALISEIEKVDFIEVEVK